jgi:hypothetical protein
MGSVSLRRVWLKTLASPLLESTEADSDDSGQHCQIRQHLTGCERSHHLFECSDSVRNPLKMESAAQPNRNPPPRRFRTPASASDNESRSRTNERGLAAPRVPRDAFEEDPHPTKGLSGVPVLLLTRRPICNARALKLIWLIANCQRNSSQFCE